MPLSSTPTTVNTIVFPLPGVLPPPAKPVQVKQAVNRSGTY